MTILFEKILDPVRGRKEPFRKLIRQHQFVERVGYTETRLLVRRIVGVFSSSTRRPVNSSPETLEKYVVVGPGDASSTTNFGNFEPAGI